jgi:hypothetical protein
VALAGVVTEYLRFGQAEGGVRGSGPGWLAAALLSCTPRGWGAVRSVVVLRPLLPARTEQAWRPPLPQVGDIMQLDGMFRGLGFTQMKADGEVRWAVLNVAQLLRQHQALHDDLAQAFVEGRSSGQCIALIELQLAAAA